MAGNLITWHLEMLSLSELKEKENPDPLLAIYEQIPKDFRMNRFLYKVVGEKWIWIDKLGWTDQQWIKYAEADNLRTYVAYLESEIAGYYELQSQPEGNIEIAYFGLAPNFIGKGFGGYLLTHAIQTAWSLRPRRVWLHTCNLDHPGSLTNYQNRGFKVFLVEKN